MTDQHLLLHQVIEALQRGAAHESLVCCAAYLLGEYGRQVEQVPVRDQFNLLQERFVTVSSEAKVRSHSIYLGVYCICETCICEPCIWVFAPVSVAAIWHAPMQPCRHVPLPFCTYHASAWQQVITYMLYRSGLLL